MGMGRNFQGITAMTAKFIKQVAECCSWYKDYIKGAAKLSDIQLKYLAGLVGNDKYLLRQFPIYCVVIAKEEIVIPIPYYGRLAIVVGYSKGHLKLRHGPESKEEGFVKPELLDKVSNWRGMTPKKLETKIDWYKCQNKGK